MTVGRFGLPAPRVADASLARFLETVSEFMRSYEGNIAGVLRDQGLLGAVGGGPAVAQTPGLPADPPVLSMPPDPSGEFCRAGITTAVIFWDNPFAQYQNHALTRIYRGTADEFNNAVQIGMSTGISYVDLNLSENTTYYYWIRWEAGDPHAGVLGNPSASCEVTTSEDPAVAIRRLSAEILADPLAMQLLTPVTDTEVFQRISERVSALYSYIVNEILGATNSLLSAAITSGDTALQSGLDAEEAARAIAEAALQATIDSNTNRIQDSENNITALQSSVAGKAEATALQALRTEVEANDTDIAALSASVTSIMAQILGLATASALQALITRVTSAEGTIESNTTEITALEARITGTELGPEPNTFTGADRAAAEALRDVQAGADAAWLASYDDNPGNAIQLNWQ